MSNHLFGAHPTHGQPPLRLLRAGLALLCLTLAGSAQSAPAAARGVEAWAADYLACREVQGFGRRLTLPEAQRIQKEFVKQIQPELGRPTGYKVGLVNREAQQKYGVTTPLRGVLLEKMLLANGAEVRRDFAVRPMLEADLVVVVKDKAINKAASILEVAEHLKDVIGFIELPDMFIPTNPPPDGPLLLASNLGARLGVLGQRLPVAGTGEFARALAEMRVTITDDEGRELGRGQGKNILDHPLNAVLWLLEELHRNGQRLKPGDLISLGSIAAIPLPSARDVTVRYDGLPGGTLSTSVRFR